MSATLIDGKAIAAKIRGEIGKGVTEMKAKHNYVPGLATV
jgi:methylenetetrahydrofolate dehydrogenase (NADP+)/methenyltetrahydrofolate cyclohydrolase